MQTFCDKIYNWCNEIVSWQPGDNDSNFYWVEESPETIVFYGPDSSQLIDLLVKRAKSHKGYLCRKIII
jgi:hypothetical protein